MSIDPNDLVVKNWYFDSFNKTRQVLSNEVGTPTSSGLHSGSVTIVITKEIHVACECVYPLSPTFCPWSNTNPVEMPSETPLSSTDTIPAHGCYILDMGTYGNNDRYVLYVKVLGGLRDGTENMYITRRSITGAGVTMTPWEVEPSPSIEYVDRIIPVMKHTAVIRASTCLTKTGTWHVPVTDSTFWHSEWP